MFVFMGKKEINSSAGFGHLTVTEDDGTVVEYIAGLNDILYAEYISGITVEIQYSIVKQELLKAAISKARCRCEKAEKSAAADKCLPEKQ